MASSSPEQLFVSLNLPDPCRAAVTKLYADLEGTTWTRLEQLHLTMRFLGDVESALAERIETSLAGIRAKPFLLPLETADRIPLRGPLKVLWVGVGHGSTLLFQLQQKIDDALLAAGWRGDLRNFIPQITVARMLNADQTKVDCWLCQHRSFAGPLFRVESFQLMQSTLQPAGAVHALRTDFSLGAE